MYELFKPRMHPGANGDTLLYRLLEPTFESTDGAYPVVLFLHGAGERGDNNAQQLYHVMPEFASLDARKNHPCYVIAPQCPLIQYWTSGERMDEGDVDWQDSTNALQQMIMEVLDQVVQKEDADPARVYLIGLSMGGAGSWDLLAHYPDRFTAAVPICGWTSKNHARKIAHIPVWIFHGSDDNVIPVAESRTIYRALQDAGGSPIYTELEGVRHNAWDFVFSGNALVMDWLFSKRK